MNLDPEMCLKRLLARCPTSRGLFRNSNRPVIVAVIAVRMMEVSVNQVVNMIAMRDGGMAAVWPMNVLRRMPRSSKPGRALFRVHSADGNRVLVHMIAMRMMQMAVMKIIHMAFMVDGCVAAAGAMDVRMVRVSGAGMFLAHKCVLLVRFLADIGKEHRRAEPDKQFFCKRLAWRNCLAGGSP